MSARAWEYRHRVAFEETSLVGSVYYVNHLRWQGRCRELFLLAHAPSVLADLGRDLALVTLRCSCEYLAELSAFDEVVVRMRLLGLAQNRLSLGFEYWRVAGGAEALVARGEQQIACMRREAGGLVAAPVPEALRDALAPYGGEAPGG